MDRSHYVVQHALAYPNEPRKIYLLAHIFVIRKVNDVIQQPPGTFEVEIPRDSVSRIKSQVNMDSNKAWVPKTGKHIQI